MQTSRTKYAQMDPDLKEMIEALKQMEIYNEHFINNASGDTLKKIVALATYKAATDYAEAIRIINTTHPFAKVSKVLIRPLFESLINILYIDTRDDDLYVIESFKKVQERNLGDLEDLESYIENKGLDRIGHVHLSALRSRETKAQKNIDELEIKKIALIGKDMSDYTSKLYKQALKVDFKSPPFKPENALYFNYRLLYPYWSGAVHLGMDGITAWTKFEKKRLLINYTGESTDDVKRVIWQTFALTKDIAVAVMRIFDKYDKDFDDKYTKLIEKYRVQV